MYKRIESPVAESVVWGKGRVCTFLDELDRDRGDRVCQIAEEGTEHVGVIIKGVVQKEEEEERKKTKTAEYREVKSFDFTHTHTLSLSLSLSLSASTPSILYSLDVEFLVPKSTLLLRSQCWCTCQLHPEEIKEVRVYEDNESRSNS